MKQSLTILGGILFALALLVIGTVSSTYNTLNEVDQSIQASWKDMDVWYDKFWLSVKESAQVTDKYAEDFRGVFLSSMDARYQGKGPATFLMESNPQLSSESYTALQRTIEAGRGEYAQAQRGLVDRQRVYAQMLRSFPTVLYVGFLGFPREIVGSNAPPSDLDGDGVLTALDYPTLTTGKNQTQQGPVSIFD